MSSFNPLTDKLTERELDEVEAVMTGRKSVVSRVGELNRDVMECGDPKDAWQETVKFFRWRAGAEAGIARDLRQTASAAAEDAAIHADRAREFTHLADAMERAPVTFAASADRSPEGQDGETRLDAQHESAVVSEASETPNPQLDEADAHNVSRNLSPSNSRKV